MDRKERVANGKNSMETYTLPYVKYTTSGNLLYDSGNSPWGSVNLEPIIQSEVSQKEKNKYCILMHIYGI